MINNVLNKNNNHNRITQIKSNNTIIKDNSAIANIFNNYFNNYMYVWSYLFCLSHRNISFEKHNHNS